MNIKEVAIKYLEKGYSVFPVKEDKTPLVEWGRFSVEKMSNVDSFFNNPAALGLALVTGYNNVTCVDVDLKHDTSGELFGELSSALGSSIMSKVCLNKTVNGGYHLIFRCSKVEGSMKLASRPATRDEKMMSFADALSEGADIDVAFKTGINDKSRVLIETRGVGGYCLIPPSKGYFRIGGKIQEITVEEYDFIMDTCRSFNTYVRPVGNFVSKAGFSGENIFSTVNKDFDVLSYLEKNGWTSIGTTHHGYHKIKRPGKTSNPHSAYYDPTKNIFWCFSTSAGFELNKTYSAIDLILYFEYDDNKEKLPELRAKLLQNDK